MAHVVNILLQRQWKPHTVELPVTAQFVKIASSDKTACCQVAMSSERRGSLPHFEGRLRP